MKLRLKQSIIITITIVLAGLVGYHGSSAQSPARARSGSDWADWRGPDRNGVSQEKNLPEKWSPQGDNLLWKQPYGGRSSPIVMGDRVFMFNSAGEGEIMQERVLCFNADTGRKLWEYRFNVYSTDVPPRRIAWASPVGDPTTGNVYAFGASNDLVALSNDGKLLWTRSLTDEYGAWTTHGGRTVSPIIEGNLVIVSTVTDGIGDLFMRRHRYYAFNKLNGECVWINTPGGRPFDTTYSTPVVATVNGTRMLIAGGGDGAVHAMKVNTGETVWSYPASKRGVNPGVVMSGNLAIISHMEENLDTSEMGRLAAIDATAKGLIDKNSNADKIKWVTTNYQLGPDSPVIGDGRIYQLDAGSNLFAFDLNTGKEIWVKNLGTIQKASPVYADGKIYVGTENGKFFILKPGATGCEVLDEDQLEPEDKVELKTVVGDELIASNEQILSAVAVSRGRIFLVTTKNIYAIGKRKNPALPPVVEKADPAPAGAAVAHVQVVPADILVKPGLPHTFKVNLYDDHGRFIRQESSGAAWALEGLNGSVRDGVFTAASNAGAQAGLLKATMAGVSGKAYVRAVPEPPYSEDFSSVPVDGAPKYWLNTNGKYVVRELEGNKILVKKSDNPAFKRTRSLFGQVTDSNYTIQADVRAIDRRRQMGDGGVVAQRYELVIMGNSQKIELRSWQIEPKRSFEKQFAWKPDTWYTLKLEVQTLPGGKTRARGKAWPTADPEPAAWTLEWTDPVGNTEGSAGIFADAPSEVFFDNIKVTPNK